MMTLVAGGISNTFLSTNTSHFLNPNRINAKPILITPKSKKRDDDDSTQQSSQFRLFNLNISSKLLIQSAISLFALGFVDAGYSGDWSRIGVISKDTEPLLKMLAFVVAPLCVFLVYALSTKEDA